LIEVMAEAADQLLAVVPENSEALVTRWFGHKVDFGHV